MFKDKTCRNYKSITSSCTLKGVCDLYPLFKWHICTGPGNNILLDEPFPPPPGGEVLHMPNGLYLEAHTKRSALFRFQVYMKG